MPHSFGEFALAATGVGLAATSTAFAVIMISDRDRTPTFSGIEHMMIFARPASGGGKSQARRIGGPAVPLEPDHMPVGSIAPLSPSGPGEKADERRRTETLARGIFNGKALVEVPTGFVLVEPGSSLPGLGTVLAIEPRDGKWVVVTGDRVASVDR